MQRTYVVLKNTHIHIYIIFPWPSNTKALAFPPSLTIFSYSVQRTIYTIAKVNTVFWRNIILKVNS